MMKPAQIFKIGDRVAERPKSTIIPNLRSDSIEKIAKYRYQRFGVVVDVFVKTSTTKDDKLNHTKFLKILWDGKNTPSNHAQMRICHERDFHNEMKNYGQSIGS